METLAKLARLTTTTHDCHLTGSTYVYAVLSRRARGVSVGINLNPNAACNWRCVYCQVPDLRFGNGPSIDLALLERELGEVLDDASNAELLARLAPEGMRKLASVAFSGDGEPTTSPDFVEAVDVLARVLERTGLRGQLEAILITNGSMVHKPRVQEGLARLAELGGQVWFKLDSATSEGAFAMNGSRVRPEHHLEGLRICARLCPTWVQTCALRRRGEPPSELEQKAYLDALGRLVGEGVPIRGVHLYTLARTSHQPEASELEALDPEWLEGYAARIARLGLEVRVAP